MVALPKKTELDHTSKTGRKYLKTNFARFLENWGDTLAVKCTDVAVG